MQLKFGSSSLILTKPEHSVKHEFALVKFQRLTKYRLVIIAFSLATYLVFSGHLWLSLGIFLSLIVLFKLLLNGMKHLRILSLIQLFRQTKWTIYC